MAKKNKTLKKAIRRAIKRSTIGTVAEKSAAAYVKKAKLDEMARNPDAAARTPIPIYRPKGVDMPKNKKNKAKKAKLATLRKAIGNLAVSDEGESRRKALLKSMNAAINVGDLQAARSLSFELAKFDGIQVRKDAVAALARAGLSDQDQPRAIGRASAQAIANAQRPRRGVFDAGASQRATLRDIFTGDYVPERPDPAETELESQRRIAELEEGLRKATSPGERERLGYQLTKARLVDGHRRGVI